MSKQNREESGVMRSAELFKRFLPYYGKYKKELAFDLCCALLTTANALVFPMLVRTITNRAVADPASIAIGWLLGLGFFYLALRALDAAANYFMQAQGHIMGARLETDMRSDLFGHLQEHYGGLFVGALRRLI